MLRGIASELGNASHCRLHGACGVPRILLKSMSQGDRNLPVRETKQAAHWQTAPAGVLQPERAAEYLPPLGGSLFFLLRLVRRGAGR
jgi:hypothetical protein